MEEKQLDIIIITHNGSRMTLDCIKSIINTVKDIDYNIIVVDNASTDSTFEDISTAYPSVHIVQNNENAGYAKAVNAGVKASNSPFLLVTNNDVIYPKDSIKKLMDYLIRSPQTGITGPQQQFPDGRWQRSYGDFPGIKLGLKDALLITPIIHTFKKILWKLKLKNTNPHEVDYLDGAVLLIRRESFESAGGFDEDYFFYTEETDFCYRLKRAGWKVTQVPESLVVHLRGGTTGNSFSEISFKLLISSKGIFCRKHLSRKAAKFFINCEIINSIIMRIIWSLFSLVPGKIKEKAINKTKIFKLFYKLWLEEKLKI